MEITVLDIVLYKSSPDTFKNENPEKFEYITEFLADPKNRHKFFQTSEELEESIRLNEKEDNNEIEAEFSLFWSRFQKEYLNENSEIVDAPASSHSFFSNLKRKAINFFFPSIVPLFLNLLIYIDGFWNHGKFLRTFLSDEIATEGVFFLQMGKNSYNLFQPVNYGILFFSCVLVFTQWMGKERIKGFSGILLGLSAIFLVFGMVWNAITTSNSSSLLPEWIAIVYLFLAILLIQKK